MEVDEAGHDDEPGRVELVRSLRGEPLADLEDRTGIPVDQHVERAVAPRRRIDDAAAAYQETRHPSPSQGRPVSSR